MEKEFICFFTGHREIDTQHAQGLAQVLDDTIEGLIAGGVTHFRTGGAIGFDTVAALKVLEKKSKYPFIHLDLYLPCRNQADRWNDYGKAVYEYILGLADGVVYAAEEYTRGCMHLRNRLMAEGADFCVAYCHRESGGTAYTVQHARRSGIKVINIFTMI